jgi:hypothetical protein
MKNIIIPYAKTNMLSNFEVAQYVADAQTTCSLPHNPFIGLFKKGFSDYRLLKNNKLRASDQMLADDAHTTLTTLALKYAETTLNNTLIPTTSNSAFIDLLSAYNANGKYTIGSEIDPSDFSNLMTYKYKTTYGAMLSIDGINTKNVTTAGDYIANDLTIATKPFSAYNGVDGTYALGEILPGYTLHAKIIDMDTDTDSNTCKLSLQFGVSQTDGDYKGQVI